MTSENIWLQSWESLRDAALIERLAESYDTPVANCDSAEDLVNLYEDERVGFWKIMAGDEFAGIFSLNPTQPHPEFYQSGTLILSQFRGSSVSRVLKQAVAKAMLDLDLPFGAHTKLWNYRSIAAIQKVFPGIEPVIHNHDGEQLWFDFSAKELDPLLNIHKSIYETIISLDSYLKSESEKAQRAPLSKSDTESG